MKGVEGVGVIPQCQEKNAIDIITYQHKIKEIHIMYLIVLLFLNTFAILTTSYLLPGVHVDGFWTAFMVSFVLGFVNVFLRPFIFILTLPINILTLGLFSFIIMGFMVYLVSQIVPGFTIEHFFWTLPFAFIASFFNWFFASIFHRILNQ